MIAVFGRDGVALGLNATADSFYSSQGRKDPNFNDANDHVIESVLRTYPDAITLDMESLTLFHLARFSLHHDKNSSIKSAAATMIFADRVGGEFITPSLIEKLENEGGKACLQALIDTEL